MTAIPLPGCRQDVLGHNLKAISLLRVLAAKLKELERKVASHDGHIQSLFEAIRQLMLPPTAPGRRIGFEVKPGESGKPKGRRR